MANELVGQFTLANMVREQTVGYNPWARAVWVGDTAGVRLNKLDTQGYVLRGNVPGNLTMGTGLTFVFELALPDVPDFDSDLGKVVRLGVTAKRIISGESLDMDAAAATEQTVDVTLQATAALVTVATLAIANANLDSLAVNENYAARVRRIGSAAQDTCRGSVAITLITIKNT
jgi:hypothetical protein